jgi:hypothetical protein
LPIFYSTRIVRTWGFALATAGAFFVFSGQSHAQLAVLGGNIGINGGQNQSPYLQRSQNQIPNPVNFWQYSQVTGVKPTFGTVTIYNQFGQQGMQQNQFQQLNQAFGGGGAGTNSQGQTQGGDDPPQGVLLHVNYANMFFPNQQRINNQNAQQPGFGGFGGGGLGGLGGGLGALGGGLGGLGGGLGALGGKFGGFNGGYGL